VGVEKVLEGDLDMLLDKIKKAQAQPEKK